MGCQIERGRAAYAQRLGLPEIVGVTEYRDIIGVAIQKAIEGAKSPDVLAAAQKEFQEVLDKTER